MRVVAEESSNDPLGFVLLACAFRVFAASLRLGLRVKDEYRRNKPRCSSFEQKRSTLYASNCQCILITGRSKANVDAVGAHRLEEVRRLPFNSTAARLLVSRDSVDRYPPEACVIFEGLEGDF